jgi:acyl carrier protein
MTKTEVEDWLAATLRDLFEIAPERLHPEATLAELDLDSIDAVDVVVQFQKLTNTRVPPDAFRSVRTLADVVNALHRLVRE